MPMVPAPAMTAGMVKTPVPTMLPMTRPVADVSPRVWAFCSLRGESAGPSGAGGGGGAAWGGSVVKVIGTPIRSSARAARGC